MKKFLSIFFWVAFASFLSASIPHVAYFFRSFEPKSDGRDILWWAVSYGIAISIDVAILAMSITVAQLHRQKKSAGLLLSVWLFTLGLTALSFYINYKYAQHFQSTAMISATPIDVPLLGRLADINPLIASLFQVLAIAYTWISDKIAADEKPKTIAELKQDAEDLEERVVYLARIQAAKNQSQSNWLKGKIDMAKGVISGKEKASEMPATNVDERAESSEAFLEHPTMPIPAMDVNDDSGQLIALDNAVWEVLARYPKLEPLLSSRASTATFLEVAEATGYTERWLRDRVEKGKLKVASRNKERILLNSVITWLKSVPNERRKESLVGTIPILTMASNGHQHSEKE